MRKFLIKKKLLYFIATGFGSGLFLNKFSGTIGSIVSILFWLIIVNISVLMMWIAIIIGFCVGCIACKQKYSFNNIHDHKSIVWDEFIGTWISLMAVPVINFKWIITAFFIFRMFDILKPWPICFFDKNIKNGFGIMFDDLIAAIFSYIIIFILYFLLKNLIFYKDIFNSY